MSDLVVRPARVDELAALAVAVAPQPLLVRYEITAEGNASAENIAERNINLTP